MRAATNPLRSLFALTLVTAGCGPSGEPPASRFQQCDVSPNPREFDGVGQQSPGAVALGEDDGVIFKPYVDGQAVELVLGFQGGTMIVPSIELALLPDDPDSICLDVTATHTIDGGAKVSAGFSGTFQFKRRGGAAYSEPIFDLLTYSQELTGRTLTLALSVDENGVTVTDEKTLILK